MSDDLYERLEASSRASGAVTPEGVRELLLALAEGDEVKFATLAVIHNDMVKEHTERCLRLDAGELTPRAFAEETNQSTEDWLNKMAEVVGEKQVRAVFGEDSVQLVDPDLMEAAERA